MSSANLLHKVQSGSNDAPPEDVSPHCSVPGPLTASTMQPSGGPRAKDAFKFSLSDMFASSRRDDKPEYCQHRLQFDQAGCEGHPSGCSSMIGQVSSQVMNFQRRLSPIRERLWEREPQAKVSEAGSDSDSSSGSNSGSGSDNNSGSEDSSEISISEHTLTDKRSCEMTNKDPELFEEEQSFRGLRAIFYAKSGRLPSFPVGRLYHPVAPVTNHSKEEIIDDHEDGSSSSDQFDPMEGPPIVDIYHPKAGCVRRFSFTGTDQTKPLHRKLSLSIYEATPDHQTEA